jgi:hypothetical protein
MDRYPVQSVTAYTNNGSLGFTVKGPRITTGISKEPCSEKKKLGFFIWYNLFPSGTIPI